MAKRVNLFGETKKNFTLEEKAQRKEAKQEMFKYESLQSEPPKWLPPSAKSEWERIVPFLKADYPLAETDYGMLITYCLAYSRIKTAENEIKKYGTFITGATGVKKANPAVRVQSKAMADMKSASNALGMTLESRAKLALNKAKTEVKADPFQELMES